MRGWVNDIPKFLVHFCQHLRNCHLYLIFFFIPCRSPSFIYPRTSIIPLILSTFCLIFICCFNVFLQQHILLLKYSYICYTYFILTYFYLHMLYLHIFNLGKSHTRIYVCLHLSCISFSSPMKYCLVMDLATLLCDYSIHYFFLLNNTPSTTHPVLQIGG